MQKSWKSDGWKMAHEIYEQCVRYQIATAEEVGQFYGYVRTEYLWEEMTADRLFVWGVWEEGQLYGVSAMQKTDISQCYTSAQKDGTEDTAQHCFRQWWMQQGVFILDRQPLMLRRLVQPDSFYREDFI